MMKRKHAVLPLNDELFVYRREREREMEREGKRGKERERETVQNNVLLARLFFAAFYRLVTTREKMRKRRKRALLSAGA